MKCVLSKFAIYAFNLNSFAANGSVVQKLTRIYKISFSNNACLVYRGSGSFF